MAQRPSNAASPGLARLLADAAPDRLRAIAEHWGVEPGVGGGQLAFLYRRMVDPAAIDAVLGRLDEATRLIFRRLVAKPGGSSDQSLLQVLPFSEESLGERLSVLEAAGLAWQTATPSRADELAGATWLVAWDVASVLSSRSRRPIAASTVAASENIVVESAGGPSPLTQLERPPTRVLPGGAGRRDVARLARGEPADGSGNDSTGQQYVRQLQHWAGALGVVDAKARNSRPGLRAAAWLALSDVEQTRVLARLWRVDDRGPVVAPAAARRGIVGTLRGAAAQTWYELDWVSRGVAWHGSLGTRDRVAAGQSDRSPTSDLIRRADIELGVLVLGWIGVLDVGVDGTGRINAIQLTDTGRQVIDALD